MEILSYEARRTYSVAAGPSEVPEALIRSAIQQCTAHKKRMADGAAAVAAAAGNTAYASTAGAHGEVPAVLRDYRLPQREYTCANGNLRRTSHCQRE